MNSTGSLQNLNDIVMPATAPWWPPAPGWYLLAGLMAAALAFLALRAWRRWRQDAYRRRALAAVAAIRDGRLDSRQLPALLKRAALSAWPRSDVAALSGAAWHAFLDGSGGGGRFKAGAGGVLDRLSYGGPGSEPPGEVERRQVVDAAEFWLRRHQAPGRESGR
jgi:hypothetical protein